MPDTALTIEPNTRVRLLVPLMGIQPRLSSVHGLAPGSVGICCGPNPHDQTGSTYLVVFDDDAEPVKAAASPDEIEEVAL